MLKTVVAGVAVGTLVLGLVGCSSTVDGTNSGQQAGTGQNGDGTGNGNGTGNGTGTGTGTGNGTSNAGKAATPQQEAAINASTVYVPETDPTKANAIVVRMWTTLTTGSGCWYMKNSADNYSFYGYNNYTYRGYETTAGTVANISAGKYGPYDAAEVMMSDRQYYVGIYDANNMAVAQQHFDGTWFMNWYEKKEGCV